MLDKGHKITDDKLKRLELRLTAEYRRANKEVTQKLESHLSKFEKKDIEKFGELQAGMITRKEYQDWRMGQMMTGKHWEDMKQSLAEDMTNVNQIAMGMVKDTLPDVYALNHNYGTYEMEKGSGIDTRYTLYDKQTVLNLAKEDSKLLPDPKVNIPKDMRWNKQHISSAVMQGVMQGEDVRKISKRLTEVTDMNRKGAIRNARTIYTGVENQAREDSYVRAQDMGIDVEQTWVATLDGRTRDSHKMMDGETRPVGDEFSNGLMFPGDPSGDPSEVYNCRCTLIGNVKGFRRNLQDLSIRNTSHMRGMSYEQWKSSKSMPKKTWESVKDYESRTVLRHVDIRNPEVLFSNVGAGANVGNGLEAVQASLSGMPNSMQGVLYDTTFLMGQPGGKCDYTNKVIYVGQDTEKEAVDHEIGHLVEHYKMNPEAVEAYKQYLVEGCTKADIEKIIMYTESNEEVETFVVRSARMQSNYQGRIYANDIDDCVRADGTIKTELMLETISEAIRMYFNEPQNMTDTYIVAMIEEALR